MASRLGIALCCMVLGVGGLSNEGVAGQFVAWGSNSHGQLDVPSADHETLVAVAAGHYHSLGLRSDGTVVGWGGEGSSYEGVGEVPADLRGVKAIAAGTAVSLALRMDGTVVAWGPHASSTLSPPEGVGPVQAIAAGRHHALALLENGEVSAWGQNSLGQTDVPDGLDQVTAVAGGGRHSLALRRDGTVIAWGFNGHGQTDVPRDLTDAVAIAAGENHSLALRANGMVVGWGWNEEGVMTPPADLGWAQQISAGDWHNVAVRHDGTLVAWGHDTNGETEISGGLGPTLALSAGGHHNLLLVGSRPQVHFLHPGLDWRYFDGSHLPDAHWTDPAYTDSGWASGPAQLGYGDGDEATRIQYGPEPSHKHTTAYFRHEFSVDRPAELELLRLYVLRDDGVVVYLNGVEVVRDNLPPGAVAFDTQAIHSMAGSDEGTFFGFNIQPSLLTHGQNVLAAEVHQVSPASGDLSFDLFLGGQLGEPVSPPNPENLPPMVTILHPPDGAVFRGEDQVSILVETVDPDGYASYVEVFAGDTRIGEVELTFFREPSPGEPVRMDFVWEDPFAGPSVLTARARDDRGRFGESLPVHIQVVDQPPPDRELHVVGVYSGTVPGGGTSHEHERGEATVVVDRPGRAVTLALTAYEPVTWHVTATEGTVIERVYVSGYYQPVIEGLEPGTEILLTSHEQDRGDYFWMGYAVDSGQFYRTAPELRRTTGLAIASFHGDYQAIHPLPYVIDEVQDDPRLQADYPRPVPPHELPDLAWSLAFGDPGRTSSGPSVDVGRYTLQGPVDGMALLPGTRVVTDDGHRYYYGTEGHEVWRIDVETAQAMTLTLGPDVPGLSWPMGVAHDSRRHRIMLVSLGGEGYLYAYDPTGQRWSVVSSMEGRDLACLTYHPADDSLYGMSTTSPDGGSPRLYRLSANGAYLDEWPLPFLPFGVGPGGKRTELVSVGDYLVMLTGTGQSIQPDRDRQTERMYLIDPRTGETWLTYRPSDSPPIELAWPDPAPITYGSPLTAAQLNAVANVPGTHRYDPPPGTILAAGVHELSVLFTPATPDTDAGAVATVMLEVRPAPLLLRADDHVREEGMPNPPLTATFEGLVAGDLPADLEIPATLTTPAGPDSPPGLYPIYAGGASDPNYRITHVNGTLTVVADSFVRRELPEFYQPGELLVVRLVITPGPDVDSFALEDQPPLGWEVSDISAGGVSDPSLNKVKFGPYFGSASRVVSYAVTPPDDADGVQLFEGTASADGSRVRVGGDGRMQPVQRYHPADISPRDERMSVHEVTAYGAAWRNGEHWTVPPHPIPVDYVTRAAWLWRGGEIYEVDASAGAPPMWWVHASVMPHGASGAPVTTLRSADEPSASAIQVVPAVYVPGQALHVQIDIVPPADAAAQAVEWACPPSCQVGEISQNGQWDAKQRTVRWGPFMDGVPRRLRVQVIPDHTAIGPLEFSGVASFDGRSIGLAGETGCAMGGQLTGKMHAEPGRVRLGVLGGPGARYRAEASADLRDWTPLGEVINQGGTIEIADPDSIGHSQRFYRVIPSGN